VLQEPADVVQVHAYGPGGDPTTPGKVIGIFLQKL